MECDLAVKRDKVRMCAGSGPASEASCSVREAGLQRPRDVCFLLYDLPGIGRSRETESLFGVTKELEEGAGMGSDYLLGNGCFYRVLKSFESRER